MVTNSVYAAGHVTTLPELPPLVLAFSNETDLRFNAFIIIRGNYLKRKRKKSGNLERAHNFFNAFGIVFTKKNFDQLQFRYKHFT